MLHDMERAGIEIVHMLTESRPISGIISFQPPNETGRELEARPDYNRKGKVKRVKRHSGRLLFFENH
jgi:hypothetical protein